jgi:hypothetical protein
MQDARFTIPAKAWLGLAMVALAAQGCARQATTSVNGIYPVDVTGGASICTAPTASPQDGQTVLAQMQVNSAGGWCGIIANRGGVPFDSYLLVTGPSHGRVYAHRVGLNTRIDYTPDRGYAGPDKFALRMIPGNGVIQSTVTVTK